MIRAIPIIVLTLTLLIVLLSSIANAQKINPEMNKIKKVYPQNTIVTLLDYIRRLSGIMVLNRGGRKQIIYRGFSSVYGENRPLFIVDGRRLGTDFNLVEKLVSVVDIADVTLMNNQEATIRYGIRAGNGAIIIKTKQ